MMVENLGDMEWVPPDYVEGREAHNERFPVLIEGLMKEYLAG
jgi:hypothetical protein